MLRELLQRSDQQEIKAEKSVKRVPSKRFSERSRRIQRLLVSTLRREMEEEASLKKRELKALLARKGKRKASQIRTASSFLVTVSFQW